MSKGETFIFAGAEIGERKDEIEKRRAALKEKYGSPIEEHSFYVGETAASEIISLLLNASLFCDARLVFVKSAELIKKKDDVEIFISYIKAPSDDTTLIFITEENGIDKKIEYAALSFGAHYKHIFYEMFEDRKESWIRNYFKKEGFSITEEGIDAILEMVENNTDALRRECSAITLFFLGKNKKTLGDDDIEGVLSAARSLSVFSLFSSICAGDFTKSLTLMHALLDAGENTYMIFSAMTSSFKRFRDFCILSLAGKGSNDFELRNVGITSLKAKNDYRLCAKLFGLNKSDELIALCAAADLQIRQTDSSYHGILMDMFLHSIFKLKK